jgi:hypothetical protein
MDRHHLVYFPSLKSHLIELLKVVIWKFEINPTFGIDSPLAVFAGHFSGSFLLQRVLLKEANEHDKTDQGDQSTRETQCCPKRQAGVLGRSQWDEGQQGVEVKPG